ncbi:MAG: hypothetical protein U0Y96_12495 [Candidatus Kapaibacterium sp.]
MSTIRILLILWIVNTSVLYSQQVKAPFPTPCFFHKKPSLTVTFPFNNCNDPYKNLTDLPIDVALKYSHFDRLCTYFTEDKINNMFNQMSTLNDTLRYAAKYLYELTDYNPFMMKYNLRLGVYKRWSIAPWRVRELLINKYASISDNGTLDRVLLYSEYVLLFTVTDTLRTFDSSNAVVPNGITVTCTIDDVIKGRYIPQCYDLYQTPLILNVSNQNSTATSCFQFDYKLEMPLSSPHGADVIMCRPCAVDSLNQPYVKKGTQYVGIFQVYILCSDSNYQYYVISPLKTGMQPYLFPVENGMINDSINEFQLGTTNTAQEFIQKLRSRIDYIRMR